MILRKIKNVLRNGALTIYRFSIRHHLPFLTARILIYYSRQITTERRKFKVLCLSKAIFIDDVKALSEYGNEISYIYFPRLMLYEIIKYFIPYDDMNHRNYYTETKYEEGREKVRAFLREVITVLQRHLRFDAVLSGNFVYFQQQEFFAVCKEQKIPIIILYKEGLAPNLVLDDYVKIYHKAKFVADKGLFYNINILDALLRAKIPGIETIEAVVVGPPRLDVYSNFPRSSGTKQVALFSFYPKDKIFYLVDNEEQENLIMERAEQFHKMVMEFAFKHREYSVIIKTKSSDQYLNYVLDIQRKYFKGEALKNLSIINIGNVVDIVCKSEFVLGYSSTTLVEAIIAGKPIISPFFGDLIHSKQWDYFREYPELVHYAGTINELEEIIFAETNRRQYSGPEVQEFLEQLVYKADGRASLRAEREIIDTINKVHKNN